VHALPSYHANFTSESVFYRRQIPSKVSWPLSPYFTLIDSKNKCPLVSCLCNELYCKLNDFCTWFVIS
jgi:hypothetical protein